MFPTNVKCKMQNVSQCSLVFLAGPKRMAPLLGLLAGADGAMEGGPRSMRAPRVVRQVPPRSNVKKTQNDMLSTKNWNAKQTAWALAFTLVSLWSSKHVSE